MIQTVLNQNDLHIFGEVSDDLKLSDLGISSEIHASPLLYKLGNVNWRR